MTCRKAPRGRPRLVVPSPSSRRPSSGRPGGLLQAVHDLFDALAGVEVPVGALALEHPLPVAQDLVALVEGVLVLVLERLVEFGRGGDDDLKRPAARLADVLVAGDGLRGARPRGAGG